MRTQTITKITNITRVSILFLTVVLFLLVPQHGARPQGEPEETVELNEIMGKMVFLTPRMITIEFARTETGSTEILIPFDEETKLSHLKSVKDLQQGDVVKVTYKESYIEGEEGKRLNFKRVAVEIAFLRRARDTLRSMGN